jgi:hypothetical protein
MCPRRGLGRAAALTDEPASWSSCSGGHKEEAAAGLEDLAYGGTGGLGKTARAWFTGVKK